MANRRQRGGAKASEAIMPIAYRNPVSEELPVEVLRVSALRAKAPASFFRRPHCADFLVILLVDDPLTHEIDLRHVHLSRGDLLVIPPGQVQRFAPAGGDGWLLLVAGSLLEPGVARSTCSPCRLGGRDEIVRGFFAELRRVQDERPSPRSRRYAHHLVHALMLAIPEEGAAPNADAGAKVLAVFRREVARRFAVTRNVADYVAATGYSATTLDRAARSLTGGTAKALIDARVLLEARRLLAYTTLSVSQIGYRLGFSEGTNFAKFFRRKSGESALTFRRRHGTDPMPG